MDAGRIDAGRMDVGRRKNEKETDTHWDRRLK